MPVPVPTRCPSHLVSKPINSRAKQSALQHLLNTLPEPPAGRPAAFADRETWIQSLPPSRRYKPRQETFDNNHFFVTTTGADQLNATQTPSVPRHSQYSERSFLASSMAARHAPLSNGKPWPPSPPDGTIIEADECHRLIVADQSVTCNPDAADDENEDWTEDEEFFAGPALQRPAPIKRRITSEGNMDGAHHVIDTSVSNAGVTAHHQGSESMRQVTDFQADGGLTDNITRLIIPRDQPIVAERKQTRKVLSPISTVVTPNDMALYRKMVADPMSEWVALYIWKVVTLGMSLPPEFVAQENIYGSLVRVYAPEPPKYLADSIRTLLCATLLQPSAIFLALWYIARFPVFFGTFAFDSESQRKEFMFRLELLGEGLQEPGAEKTRQLLQAHAPFRLILLGVMLANKWLDDNTFSNRTWHQVSGISMRALNKLESLGLDLLSHDLSLLPQAWAQWLDHLQTYHRSLTPYPEPIGPPKETPHAIIRRTIEELIEARLPPLTTGVIPEPIFLGLAEHKRERERLKQEQTAIFNIDLDEDGPLREEYLPRRLPKSNAEILKKQYDSSPKDLPPPAIWSPAADPPIYRVRPTYQAVQGPSTTIRSQYSGVEPYPRQVSMVFHMTSTVDSRSLDHATVHSRGFSQDWYQNNAFIRPNTIRTHHMAMAAYEAQGRPRYLPNTLQHCVPLPITHSQSYDASGILQNEIGPSQSVPIPWLRT